MIFDRCFSRRCAFTFFVVCFFFLGCCLRLYSIASGGLRQVQEQQSSLRLTLVRERGTIYDRNMLPLNNQYEKVIAAVSPVPRAVVAISDALKGSDELEGILERLSSGKPIVCTLPQKIECDGIVCLNTKIPHVKEQAAEHIIGYLDSSGHGVSGLEKAFDSILYSEKTVDAVFKTDGIGRVLEGEEIELEGVGNAVGNAVVTTLDINIQTIAEKAALEIDRGAVVIADAQNGEIRALVSRPSFDCTRISDYLDRPDSPLLNRALSAFNVGSAFKPCVAAAGLEKNIGNLLYKCSGSVTIADRAFKCHKAAGHGALGLSGALAESCNVFFYRFSKVVGADAVYETASNLGFGTSFEIANGISCSAGALTSRTELESLSALANLSIGQGKLLASPVAMLNLYCAIAGDGSYRVPSIVSAAFEQGEKSEYDKSSPTKAFSKQTAKTIRSALVEVIENGTGKSAKPALCTAAGKTATAQTGVYENNKEITNGWFCGFFPAEVPKYVVIIMEEKAIGSDVSPIFARIADEITENDF